MPKYKADQDGRVLDLLKLGFPDWSTSTLKQRLKNGLVTLNAKTVHSGAAPVRAGDELAILAKPASPAAFFPARLGEPPVPVVYADDSLLAVDKPSGLLSVASERERSLTAVRLMREWLAGGERERGRGDDDDGDGDGGDGDGGRDNQLHAAHRLDRDASGVLLFARTLALKRRLAADWHRFEKIYLAVVDGVPAEKEGSIAVPLWEDKGLFVRVADARGGEEALTHYRLVRTNGVRSLLEVRLGTGRKHQIRVHLAHIGCPIVGDVRYGVSKASRLALHAHILKLLHPVDGREVAITAKAPALFNRWVARRER